MPRKEQIENSTKGFIKYISYRGSKNSELRRAAKRIFNELLFPLRDPSLSAKKRLIIIPDGILYSLPFEALIDGERGGESKFLVERFEISYVPSATTLKWLSGYRISGPQSEGLLAFGDPEYNQLEYPEKFSYLAPWDKAVYAEYLSPLPMSREEIQTVAKFFPRRGRRIFLGREAREETFKQMDGHRYSVIHLACHSYIDEDFPLRSALYFSTPESESEDGCLQVRELYNMRLPADLVVLSACQTARGRMDSWEGVLSMPRNFFYMGARSVVSTLWPIEDNSSAFFMDRFYGGLARGLSTAKALQRAKIDMIHMGYAEAHYWAPFILCGDPRSKIDMRH
jgi:CHAT domain-containing protein